MLEWKDHLSTTIDDVDEQHKKLFKMINDFEQQVRDDRARSGYKDVLEFLGDYVKVHFAAEEKIMEEKQCPTAQESKEAHSKFLNVYSDFVNRFQTEGYSEPLAKELLKTTQDWLVKHICGIDVRLRYSGENWKKIGSALGTVPVED